MEQEKKTVSWLLSELQDFELEEAEAEILLHHLRSKFERYDATLKALTGMSYEEHVNESIKAHKSPTIEEIITGKEGA